MYKFYRENSIVLRKSVIFINFPTLSDIDSFSFCSYIFPISIQSEPPCFCGSYISINIYYFLKHINILVQRNFSFGRCIKILIKQLLF